MFRQLSRRPYFSALVVLLLAVGIGANVLIFTFIDTLILKPLPVKNSANLWMLETVWDGMIYPNTTYSYGQFEELQKHTELFSGVTAEGGWGESSAFTSSEANGGLRLVMTQMLAPNYFDEMGVKAYLGRVLDKNDAKPSTNVPAMISYQFWRSHYGGRADILGKVIRLKDYPFTIVGVLPEDFHSVDIERAPDVRLPISAKPFLYSGGADERGPFYTVLLRLKPNVTAATAAKIIDRPLQAVAEQEFLTRNAASAHPLTPAQIQERFSGDADERFRLTAVGSGVSRLRTQFSETLKMLMVGVLLLLVAVCANVAGLLMARGEERRKELAVRLSIGASRWKLLRQLMWENLWLAVPGGLLGLALAYALAPAMMSVLPPVRSLDQFASPQILTVAPDVAGLAFGGLILVVAVCLFGLIPAWRATGLDINAELKGTATLAPHSLAALIPVSLQVTLSVLLLAAGGLMIHNYWNLQHLNPGFDRTHVLSFTLGMEHAKFTEAQAKSYQAELEQRMLQLPGVRSVAFSTLGLMRGSGLKITITRAGAPKSKDVRLNSSLTTVTPSYFETLGIPLLAGRGLLPNDNDALPSRVVINRALQDSLFRHANPIGQMLVNGDDGSKPPTDIVVGLVETTKFRRMTEPSPSNIYVVMKSIHEDQAVMFVRTIGEPAALIKPAEDVIRKLSSSVPIIERAELEQEVQNTLWQERLVARLAGFFSVIALLLAGFGLYGTLAYSVTRRQRELGIRIAIGAQVRHVVSTVCGRMTWAVGLGLAAGLVIAVLTLRLTKQFLYDVPAVDPISLAAAVLFVLGCTALAAWVPCRKALRTDAARALRGE